MPETVQKAEDFYYEHQNYPKAVYRDREQPADRDGGWVPSSPYEVETVVDEDEERQALEAGWRLTAEKPAEDQPKREPRQRPAPKPRTTFAERQGTRTPGATQTETPPPAETPKTEPEKTES